MEDAWQIGGWAEWHGMEGAWQIGGWAEWHGMEGAWQIGGLTEWHGMEGAGQCEDGDCAAVASSCRQCNHAHGCLPTSPPRPASPQLTMLVSGCLFLLGAGLQAGARSLTQLILGRSVLGFGVGERHDVSQLPAAAAVCGDV